MEMFSDNTNSKFRIYYDLSYIPKGEIINLKTGEQPKWENGSPTFIHLLVYRI